MVLVAAEAVAGTRPQLETLGHRRVPPKANSSRPVPWLEIDHTGRPAFHLVHVALARLLVAKTTSCSTRRSLPRVFRSSRRASGRAIRPLGVSKEASAREVGSRRGPLASRGWLLQLAARAVGPPGFPLGASVREAGSGELSLLCAQLALRSGFVEPGLRHHESARAPHRRPARGSRAWQGSQRWGTREWCGT